MLAFTDASLHFRYTGRIVDGPVLAPDRDGDEVADAVDNCPADANAGQADADGDKTGDACDGDIDGDGAPNGDDAFPRDPDEQADTDGDGTGDNADNCRTTANASQADLDRDGSGDACDGDIDGDGVANAGDAFPHDPDERADADRDGTGDNADNCRTTANADQGDLDRDGTGDACDDDIDGDGVRNSRDAFPRDATETRDRDRDGVGDNGDNCRNIRNADQADADRDGIGSACDNAELPVAEDDCRDGGWRTFRYGSYRFRSESECLTYIRYFYG